MNNWTSKFPSVIRLQWLLSIRVARFFGRRAYRFLAAMIFGASVMLGGIIVGYRQLQQGLEKSEAGLYIGIACLGVYSAAAVWYAYRIHQGTWQRVWIWMLRQLGSSL